MSDDPDSRLREFLKNCKVPLSRDDWAGFFKELDALNQTYRNLYDDWIKPRRARISKTTLDDGRVKDSFILALHQITELRSTVRVLERLLTEECEAGGNAGLNKRVNEWWPQHQKQEAKKKRDRKPAASYPVKNWLEPMPIFNEGEPCGYVQATGQRRKVVENFLRSIEAKQVPAPPGKKLRGKPKQFFGFKTNCRVLNQWLGTWCDQHPEAKLNLITREALMLAETVADSKNPTNGKRLARLRRILRTNAKDAARQLDEYAGFDFLASPEACAAQIQILREKFPPPVELSFEERFSAYINKVMAGEPAEYPF